MRVGAYQMALSVCDSMQTVSRIASQIRWCESHGVEVLCCPEAILGGLADYAAVPAAIALRVDNGQLLTKLSPLASDRVTTILGFTELGKDGRLYNAAAILHQGTILGVYRKVHPAIRRSVYAAGTQLPVFTLANVTIGILLCYDSTFREPAAALAAQGAQVLFVPTNTGLPAGRAGPKLVHETRECDRARAVENRVHVVRADVTGQNSFLNAHGTTAVTNSDGLLIQAAYPNAEEVVVAEIPGQRQSATSWRVYGVD